MSQMFKMIKAMVKQAQRDDKLEEVTVKSIKKALEAAGIDMDGFERQRLKELVQEAALEPESEMTPDPSEAEVFEDITAQDPVMGPPKKVKAAKPSKEAVEQSKEDAETVTAKTGVKHKRMKADSSAFKSKEFIDSPPPGSEKAKVSRKKRSSAVVDDEDEDDEPNAKKSKAEPKKRKPKAAPTGDDAEIADLRKLVNAAGGRVFQKELADLSPSEVIKKLHSKLDDLGVPRGKKRTITAAERIKREKQLLKEVEEVGAGPSVDTSASRKTRKKAAPSKAQVEIVDDSDEEDYDESDEEEVDEAKEKRKDARAAQNVETFAKVLGL